MSDDESRAYRVIQLGPPNARGVQTNIGVENLDSVVTHHPSANRNIRMENGTVVGAENPRTRSYAMVGGEFQEIETRRTDEYRALGADQALLIKDFILEDGASKTPRAVDVPSPIAGYVGRVDARNGLVEIHDREGGNVVARLRHMNPIGVEQGQNVVYGQALGTQDNQGLPATAGKHVHIEMDTRHYQEFENYIADLTSGRLPVQASGRAGVLAQPVADDGTFRVGESGESIRDLQRVMASEGYRLSGDRPIPQDGIYRLDMQAAVLAFQRDHGLPQTGDVDPATMRLAPPLPQRDVDRQDSIDPLHGRMPQIDRDPPRDPRHPDHPDHRLYGQARTAVEKLEFSLGRPWDENSERLAASLTVLAKRNGFDQIREAAFNQATQTRQAGELVFITRDRSPDPAANRAVMSTSEAIAARAPDTFARLETLNESLRQEQVQAFAQQQAQTSQENPVRTL